jgi:hypothetical protein
VAIYIDDKVNNGVKYETVNKKHFIIIIIVSNSSLDNKDYSMILDRMSLSFL